MSRSKSERGEVRVAGRPEGTRRGGTIDSVGDGGYAGLLRAGFRASIWAESAALRIASKVLAEQMPAQDNGMRRGRVGKRRLGLRDDRRLNQWQ